MAKNHLIASLNSPIIRHLADQINAKVATHTLRDGRQFFYLRGDDGWQSNSFGSCAALEVYCEELLSGMLTRDLILGGASRRAHAV